MANQPHRRQPSAEGADAIAISDDDDDFDYALPNATATAPRPNNVGTSDNFTELCGFPESVLKRLHEHIGLSCCRFIDIVAAALYVHMSTTYSQLGAIMSGCFGAAHATPTGWLERVKRVARGCAMRPVYRRAAPEEEDLVFPEATMLVDGVPVFLNADDGYYNGKKKRRYISVQVVTDLCGVPLWCCFPRRGRVHDATALADVNSGGRHGIGDIDEFSVLADKAYVANRGCLTQYKKPPHGHLTMKQKFFNHALAHRRAKVEHFFARLQRHNFMQRCKARQKKARRLWFVVWNLEMLSLPGPVRERPPPSTDQPCRSRTPAEKRARDEHRAGLARHFWEQRATIAGLIYPKVPAKAKKGTTPSEFTEELFKLFTDADTASDDEYYTDDGEDVVGAEGEDED